MKADVFNGASFSDFSENISDLNSQYQFVTPWKYTDGTNPRTSGIFHSEHGFSFRVMHHKEHNAYILFASKGSSVFRGASSNETEEVRPMDSAISRGYPISAFRLKDHGGNKEKIFEEFSKVMKTYDEKRWEEAGHTVHVRANFSNDLSCFHDINTISYGNGVDLSLNLKGYDVTRYDQGRAGKDRADKNMSVYRSNGSFHKVSYKKWFDFPGRIYHGISHASHNISKRQGALESRYAIDQDRRKTDGDIWERRHLHMRASGFTFAAKATLYSGVNYIHSKAKEVAVQLVGFGGFYAKFSGLDLGPPGVVAATAGTTALTHFALHVSTSEFFDNFKGACTRVRCKFKGHDIQKPNFNTDIAFMFMKGSRNILFGRHNMQKSSPHADPEMFSFDQLSYIPPEDSSILAKKLAAEPEHNLDDYALNAFILKLHQKNLPMKVYQLDHHMRAFEVDNGCAGIMYKNPEDQSLTVYVSLNPDLCENEGLRLPEGYEKKFHAANGADGFVQYGEHEAQKRPFLPVIKVVAREEEGALRIPTGTHVMDAMHVMHEVDNLLLNHQGYVHDEHRKPSRRCALEVLLPHLRASEALPNEEDRERFRSMGAITLPSNAVVMPKPQYIDSFGSQALDVNDVSGISEGTDNRNVFTDNDPV